MRHDRTVIGYHGCDASVAERVLAGEPFVPSDNNFDWLGRGVYFWEYGADRALRFAEEQRARGKVATPAVVRAVLQLAECFDLLDTRFTQVLATEYPVWEAAMNALGVPLRSNAGATPDQKLRRLDCAVLNWVLGADKSRGRGRSATRSSVRFTATPSRGTGWGCATTSDPSAASASGASTSTSASTSAFTTSAATSSASCGSCSAPSPRTAHEPGNQRPAQPAPPPAPPGDGSHA